MLSQSKNLKSSPLILSYVWKIRSLIQNNDLYILHSIPYPFFTIYIDLYICFYIMVDLYILKNCIYGRFIYLLLYAGRFIRRNMHCDFCVLVDLYICFYIMVDLYILETEPRFIIWTYINLPYI